MPSLLCVKNALQNVQSALNPLVIVLFVKLLTSSIVLHHNLASYVHQGSN